MDPLNITREEVSRQLMAKHDRALAVIREEFEKYSKLEGELDKAAETYRKARDKFNEQVQSLKGSRQEYYQASRKLRNDFFSHAKKKKSMEDIPMEVLILTKQIDQFEWEIQTEAVKIDEEKKLVKNIKDNLVKIQEYANKYKEFEDVSKALNKLTTELNIKLAMAEKKHDEMLAAVKHSDEQHEHFVEAVMKLRDVRAKRVGFQRDLEKHTKAHEHWKKVAEREARVQATGSNTKSNTAGKDEKPKPEPPSKQVAKKDGAKLGKEAAAPAATTSATPRTTKTTKTTKTAKTTKTGSDSNGGVGNGQ